MERIPVTSSSIATVGYDEDSATLEIEFEGGAVYQYFDVPSAVHAELVGAGSVGAYHAQQIKGAYRYARV